MDFDHVNAKISEVQEKYKNLKESLVGEINNLSSVEHQFKLLVNDFDSFINQVVSHVNSLPDDDASGKITLLANSISQIRDYAADRPSVINFQIEKYRAMISLLEDFSHSGESLKKGFKDEEKNLNRVAKELEKGKTQQDLTKRKKPGRRVEKIRDVRNAESKKSISSKKKSNKKKITKKSKSK